MYSFYVPLSSSPKAYYKNVDWLNLFHVATVAKTNIFESVQLDLPPPPSVLSVLL